MAALERLSVVAHGGAGGLAVELGLLVLVAAIGVAAWLAARRGRGGDDAHE